MRGGSQPWLWLAAAALAAAAASTAGPHCDASTDTDWPAAAARVRAAAARTFDGYEQHAWGHDELRPVSNRSRDNWGALAVTMIDSLDTLLLMGLTDRYERARDWLLDNLPARLEADVDVPFFEVTIRGLGGLLGAHTLSADPALLRLAETLGLKLAKAFESPSGLPHCTVSLAQGKSAEAAARTQDWQRPAAELLLLTVVGRRPRRSASCPASDFGPSIPLSELGSVQLEFGALAVLTEQPQLAAAADGALRALRRLPSWDGLYPSRVRAASAASDR